MNLKKMCSKLKLNSNTVSIIEYERYLTEFILRIVIKIEVRLVI